MIFRNQKGDSVAKLPPVHIPALKLEPAHQAWSKEHLVPCIGKGWRTSAYYGIQWGNSRWYISEHCGCGSRFRMMKGEEPIIDQKEFVK